MTEMNKKDLLELQEAIQEALELTNHEISNVPASEVYDDIFVFMISKILK